MQVLVFRRDEAKTTVSPFPPLGALGLVLLHSHPRLFPSWASHQPATAPGLQRPQEMGQPLLVTCPKCKASAPGFSFQQKGCEKGGEKAEPWAQSQKTWVLSNPHHTCL